MAFSICCREPSSSPSSSSEGPTALHKPGKDAISALGSWQSGLTPTHGTGSRRLTNERTGRTGEERRRPPAVLLQVYPGKTASLAPRNGWSSSPVRRRCLARDQRGQVGVLRETPVLLLFGSAGNTPFTSGNRGRLKRQGSETARSPRAAPEHGEVFWKKPLPGTSGDRRDTAWIKISHYNKINESYLKV